MARSQGEGDLKDFWQEFKDIESSKEPDEEEEVTKTPDGRFLWLQQILILNTHRLGRLDLKL